MSAVGKIMGTATSVLRIVDPYMDEKTLTDFAVLAAPRIRVELLADETSVKPTFKPAVGRFRTQFGGERPIEARLAKGKSLHDRLIVVDGTTAYTITQSLNRIALRSPASIIRADDDTAALKIRAYDDFWSAAEPL